MRKDIRCLARFQGRKGPRRTWVKSAGCVRTFRDNDINHNLTSVHAGQRENNVTKNNAAVPSRDMKPFSYIIILLSPARETFCIT